MEREFSVVHDAGLENSRGKAVEQRLFRRVTDLNGFIFTDDSGAFAAPGHALKVAPSA